MAPLPALQVSLSQQSSRTCAQRCRKHRRSASIIRKDPKIFRSMRAEYDVLPGANGSARIALEDDTEALVGVEAELERSQW